MEARLRSHYREHRVPDWPAAAVAGFAAGAILMVLDLIWSILVPRGNPWVTSHMIAAMWTGPETLQSSGFNAAVVLAALLTHYVLGVAFAMILVAFTSGFRLDTSLAGVLGAAAVFSVALYLLNFHAMVRFFPWFADIRGWPTLFAHLIFGLSAAFIYWKLDRHVAERR